jgi:hypothetical protein
MSEASLDVAGILLITVPLVAFGGARLLRMIWGRDPGYMDNQTRRSLWRAGHAHAGVLVLLALVGMLYVDQAGLSESLARLVRIALVLPPILMPLGFFLSVASPRAERPNRLIWLVPLGGLSLIAATLTLGIALLTA